MPTCSMPTCDKPTSDALVCWTCTDDYEHALADVGALWAELLTVLTKQAHFGAPRVAVRFNGQPAVQPLPYDTRAAELRWVLVNVLSVWVLVLAADGERLPGQHPADCARWLISRVARMRQHADAVQAMDEIEAVIDSLRWLIDRPADRQFVGVCSNRLNGVECVEHLYARHGAHEVRCRVCGTTHDVAARLDVLRGAVRDVLARPSEIARAVNWLGEAVRADQLSRWVKAGRLQAHGHDRAGAHVHALYRIGDVLDLLAASR